MIFDTHCHLNFKAFDDTRSQTIEKARSVDVKYLVVPGVDLESSSKAVEIAEKYEGVYAAVGIHPHHLNEIVIRNDLESLKKLISNKKVVAIGEVGIDRYIYKKTKYENYENSQDFIDLQKELLGLQINLAIEYNKSLILHNRLAKQELLKVLNAVWNKKLENKTVFHCCEPDEQLLEFAKIRRIFVGVDGDVTYDRKKQEFVKKIPLDLLVLETDAPFLLPEPLKSQKKYPNEPANLPIIVNFIARLLAKDDAVIGQITAKNAKKLFL